MQESVLRRYRCDRSVVGQQNGLAQLQVPVPQRQFLPFERGKREVGASSGIRMAFGRLIVPGQPLHLPDIAIVDLNLRDGEAAYDLIDRLHEQGVRVIVMTGYSEVQLAPGKAAAILHKPLGDEQLLAALHRVTKGAKSGPS